ncbi:hypothetical protein PRIPAC_95653 [Pristionchus pacificus]|uniref:SCP domain-containing protein n=1 Tax=Pristionchus pacificus TaxID=54126 RepID=A0A2A6D0R3_PRIPA|nr:hypothetical protein PRIPAC_95653 [Pristionchus pacificus]|eukprot:PDM83960.1 hypothetical protein PRIPAC_34152 [Pristionchus pacificus]
MAWAKSTKLGCGMKLCDGDKKVLVVCQYIDAGNFMNQNTYDEDQLDAWIKLSHIIMLKLSLIVTNERYVERRDEHEM